MSSSPKGVPLVRSALQAEKELLETNTLAYKSGVSVTALKKSFIKLGPFERLFGVVGNCVPDPGVGNVDGAEEVGGRVAFNFPEERPASGCKWYKTFFFLRYWRCRKISSSV